METLKQAIPQYGERLLNTIDPAMFHRCCVVCAPEAWALVESEFPRRPECVMVPESMEMSVLENQISRAPDGIECWFGIGGGSAVDAAKMAAWKRGGRLVLMPSIVSVDAAFTAAVGVRVGHRVRYVGSVHPDHLLIDFNLLRRSPRRLNVAGVGDILSIFTALPDWRLGRDMVGESWDAGIESESAGLLARLFEGVDEIGRCSDKGLRLISDLYFSEVELCDRHGNSRPEEGSEHYFAYCLESRTRRPYIHGELISMAVVLTGIWQGQDVSRVVEFLDRAEVFWRPEQVDVSPEQILETLLALPEYLSIEKQLLYGIYHQKPPSKPIVAELLEKFYSYVG